MATPNAEAELIFNRANVSLARSQKLIASWLPQAADSATVTKSDEELQREEDEMFTPVPEKLGLGAPVPKDQGNRGWTRPVSDSNDKLRKQLLGQNFEKTTTAVAANGRLPLKGKTVRNAADTGPDSDTETEDESRSNLGKRKRKRVDAAHHPASDGPTGEADKSVFNRNSSRINRGGSYLDELLSKRSRRQ